MNWESVILLLSTCIIFAVKCAPLYYRNSLSKSVARGKWLKLMKANSENVNTIAVNVWTVVGFSVVLNVILNRQSASLSRFLPVLPKLSYHLLNTGFYHEQQLCPTAENHTPVLLVKVTFTTQLTTVFSLFQTVVLTQITLKVAGMHSSVIYPDLAPVKTCTQFLFC